MIITKSFTSIQNTALANISPYLRIFAQKNPSQTLFPFMCFLSNKSQWDRKHNQIGLTVKERV